MEGVSAEDIRVYSSNDTKCPSCGGKLVFEPVEQMLKCGFCGNTYTPEKLELLSQLPEIDAGAADENEDDKCEIVCNSCGAVLITDKNTAATSCSFCGSPAIISRRLTKQFRPDYLIPFKITREEAQEKFIEFVKVKKYVPRDYLNKSNLNKIQGIYVPFWIMSSRCMVSARGNGIKQRAVYKDNYQLMSDFDVKYNNVPFDGSLEIADGLMEAIEPFDISQRKPFNSSYLQGFYAQKFNLTADNLCDRILTRMEHYGRETAAMSFSGYDSVKIGACGVKPYELEHSYALYPVWFLNYKYGDRNYMVAVNGQTGKTDGYLPVDETKRRARLIGHRTIDALLVLLGLAIVGGILAAIFFAGLNFIQSGAGLVFLLALVIFASPIGMLVLMGFRFSFTIGEKAEPVLEFLTRPITKLAAARRKSYMELLNRTNMVVGPRPSADTYYDSKAKIEFNNSEVFNNIEM
jgi:predicted RNA-binding Zn-ribbon protein involved in translation (DUF1610 family)